MCRNINASPDSVVESGSQFPIIGFRSHFIQLLVYLFKLSNALLHCNKLVVGYGPSFVGSFREVFTLVGLSVMAVDNRLAAESARVRTALGGLLGRLFVFHVFVVEGLSLDSLLHGPSQVVVLDHVRHLIVSVLYNSSYHRNCFSNVKVFAVISTDLHIVAKLFLSY